MIGPLPQYRNLYGEPQFPSMQMDRGYDSGTTRTLLDRFGFAAHIAVKASPLRSRPGGAGRSSGCTRG